MKREEFRIQAFLPVNDESNDCSNGILPLCNEIKGAQAFQPVNDESKGAQAFQPVHDDITTQAGTPVPPSSPATHHSSLITHHSPPRHSPGVRRRRRLHGGGDPRRPGAAPQPADAGIVQEGLEGAPAPPAPHPRPPAHAAETSEPPPPPPAVDVVRDDPGAPRGESPTVAIVEEGGAVSLKPPRNLWLWLGIGIVGCVCAVGFLIRKKGANAETGN